MSFRRSIQRIAAIAATALIATIVSAGSAFAEPSPLIDPNKDVTLSVHKFLGATQDTSKNPNDGRQLDESSFTNVVKLNGVVYDVYQVDGVDLTSNSGWEAAKALNGHKITGAEIAAKAITAGNSKYSLTGPHQITTANGIATYTGEPGLFLVNENLAGSTKVTDSTGKEIDKSTITSAPPFLVTLPMTDPVDRNTWMYDVHVYPKNTSDQITKDVLDGNTASDNQNGYTVGKNLTYRLLSTVSAIGDANGDGSVNGKDLGYYLVSDGLSEHVSYQSLTVKLVSVDEHGFPTADITDSTLTACTPSGPACDYWTLTPPASARWTGVQVVFTTVGLNKLVAAQQTAGPGLRVQTDIIAKLTSIPGDGHVHNTGSFVPSKPWWDQNHPAKPVTPPDGDNPPPTPPTPPDEPGIPSNPVVSKYGDIVLHKTSDSKTENLQGAEFALYRASKPNTCAATDVQGTPIATAVANGNGLYKFENLQLSNWINNSHDGSGELGPEKYRSYCLVETKAPDGYQLLAQPLMINLLKAGKIETADKDWSAIQASTGGAVSQVVNMPDNFKNHLPLTGAAGVITMSLVGVALVGTGLGFFLLARRRKDSATS